MRRWAQQRCVQRRWAQRDDRGLSELESELARLGVSLHGYADVRGLFSGEWGEWPRAISLALALPVDELRDVRSGGPTPAYYDAYLAANAILNAASREVASLLQHLGYRATPYPATVSAGDLQADLGAALTAPVHHKAVATRAGLGWIGRSGLLVTRTLGPRVRLATVFTDMLLPVAAPIDAGQCGTCRCCVDACPAAKCTSFRGHPGERLEPGHVQGGPGRCGRLSQHGRAPDA